MTTDETESFNFKCKLSNNCLEYNCHKESKTACISYSNIDPNIPKLYFVILRVSIDALKEKGYEKVVQNVTQDDWNNYLSKSRCKDKWKIKNTTKYDTIDLYTIECDIDDALACISSGLGCE